MHLASIPSSIRPLQYKNEGRKKEVGLGSQATGQMYGDSSYRGGEHPDLVDTSGITIIGLLITLLALLLPV